MSLHGGREFSLPPFFKGKGHMKKKRRSGQFAIGFLPVLSAFLLSFLSIALLCGALLIIGSADKLGLAFWPVLLAYLGLLAAAVAVIHWRRELRDFRVMVGDEDFFRLYPREAKREQRRQARTRRREARRKKSS